MKNFSWLIAFLLFFSIHLFSSQIQVSGPVSGIWDADTVLVVDDINIANNEVLIVNPGVTILFEGHFIFKVAGQLVAQGNENENIMFSVIDTTGFSDLQSNEGAWNGLWFDHVANVNDSSLFEYCHFQYGKAVGEDSAYWYGGAVCVREFNKIRFSHCRFENNMAYKNGGAVYNRDANIKIEHCHFENNSCGLSDLYGYGGGLCLEFADAIVFRNYFTQNSSTGVGGGLSFEYSDPRIISNEFNDNFSAIGGGFVSLRSDSGNSVVNNLVVGNSSLFFGGGIAVLESNTLFVNNTIVENFSMSGGGLYLNANAAPTFKNCIFWDNWDYSGEGSQVYIWDIYSAPEFYYCDVEGGVEQFGGSGGGSSFIGIYENCLEENPQFISSGSHPYSINEGSVCINAGTSDTSGLFLPEYDFVGNARIVENTIDMGAYEYQNSMGEDLHNFEDVVLQVYPNPFSTKLTIDYFVENGEEVSISLYGPQGDKVAILVNNDKIPGKKTICWEAISVLKNGKNNGFYYLKRETINRSVTKKIIYSN